MDEVAGKGHGLYTERFTRCGGCGIGMWVNMNARHGMVACYECGALHEYRGTRTIHRPADRFDHVPGDAGTVETFADLERELGA